MIMIILVTIPMIITMMIMIIISMMMMMIRLTITMMNLMFMPQICCDFYGKFQLYLSYHESILAYLTSFYFHRSGNVYLVRGSIFLPGVFYGLLIASHETGHWPSGLTSHTR